MSPRRQVGIIVADGEQSGHRYKVRRLLFCRAVAQESVHKPQIGVSPTRQAACTLCLWVGVLDFGLLELRCCCCRLAISV